MAAPKKQPAGLKLLNGRRPGVDSGGRPVAPPPAFIRLAPEPPEWLSQEAKDEWERVTPELERLGILKTIDRAALTAYCECWSRFVTAQMSINYQGMFTEGSMGQRVKSPAVQVAQDAAKELRGWCSEFGFTPSAEGNLNLGTGSSDDDEDPFGAS